MKIIICEYKDFNFWGVDYFIDQYFVDSIYKVFKLKEVLFDLTNERKITLQKEKIYQEPTISSINNRISARKKSKGGDFKVKSRVEIKPGDLVVARMHTQNGLFAFSDDYFQATQTFIPFRWNKSLIIKDYLFLILKKYLRKLKKIDQVLRETYTREEILNIKIPLPPLNIQNRIVENYFSKTKQIKELEQQILEKEKEVENYLIRELDLNIIEQKNSYSYTLDFKDAYRLDFRKKIFKVNCKKEIDLKTISQVIDVNPRVEIKNNQIISFVPMNSISADEKIENEIIDNYGAKYKNYTHFKNGDILLASITPCYENGKFLIANLTTDFGVGTTELFVLRSDDETLKKYVLILLKSSWLKTIGENEMIGTTGRKRLPKYFLENIFLPFPPRLIQHKIITHIEKLKKEKGTIKNKIKQLEKEIIEIDLEGQIENNI